MSGEPRIKKTAPGRDQGPFVIFWVTLKPSRRTDWSQAVFDFAFAFSHRTIDIATVITYIQPPEGIIPGTILRIPALPKCR